MLGDLEQSEKHRDYGYCRRIKVEVKSDIHKMHRDSTTGLDEISVEFWKSSGGVDLEWLTELFNVVFKTVKMPEARR